MTIFTDDYRATVELLEFSGSMFKYALLCDLCTALSDT